MRYTIVFSVVMVVIGSGCGGSKPVVFNKSKPTTTYGNYEEDLSGVRPRYQIATKTASAPAKKPEIKRVNDQSLHVNRQLDAALDTMAVRNRAIRFAAGYRIQIYVGNVRTDADAARLFIYQTYPELNPYTTFTQPTYRVKIGDFMNRMDAERYLQQLRSQYPTSVILADKIDLKKSLAVK
jgi:SPOR domain